MLNIKHTPIKMLYFTYQPKCMWLPPLNHCLDFINVSSKQTPLATFYGTDKSIFGCLNFFGWEILGLFTYKVD